MRSILLDWLVEVAQEFNLNDDTLFLSVRSFLWWITIIKELPSLLQSLISNLNTISRLDLLLLVLQDWFDRPVYFSHDGQKEPPSAVRMCVSIDCVKVRRNSSAYRRRIGVHFWRHLHQRTDPQGSKFTNQLDRDCKAITRLMSFHHRPWPSRWKSKFWASSPSSSRFPPRARSCPVLYAAHRLTRWSEFYAR